MIPQKKRYWLLDVLALLAGALYPLAFAPFDLYPLVIISMATLFSLWFYVPERSLWQGWLFGFGLFGVGTSWVYVSIHDFSGVWAWLAVLITMAFAAVLAVYFLVLGWLARQLMAPKSVAMLLVFPALWVLVEWLRGWLFTGFPWLVAGYSQIDTVISGYAAYFGVYGVSYVLALMAGSLALLVKSQRLLASGLLAGLLMIGFLGQYFALSQTEETGDSLRVSMIQGNITQDRKWLSEELRPTLQMYHRLTEQHWDSDLILWPETAMPILYQSVKEPYILPLAKKAKAHHTTIIAGVPIGEGEHYYNSMVAFGDHPLQFYHKVHLVPFGEFMPFESILGNLLKALKIPMAHFAGGGDQQPLFHIKNIPIAMSICYEDAFGEEIISALPEAQLLVNVSNDAWFGESLAAPQHLQMAQMRALESGRTLLRNTNTGISAVINPDGSIQQQLASFKRDVLTATVKARAGLTGYALWGNAPVIILVLIILAFGGRLARERS
ncbi:MAG: apolipoprotein N-acyltransferase [Methylococcales bacterium]|jgi:apolipoprotein N-acyltransferase|nr:apolipoprotein N-acyltransferase [Methylococcales bacterium]MBT7442591.1 apolipoprotein N-acyltransferase [Methylococcales bacterium]